MTDNVKGSSEPTARRAGSRRGRALRSDLVAETERRILTAAADLFQRQGYAATTLAAVARAAEVGERTVYVRFGTKVALFRRVVDVTVAGDTGPSSVRQRTRDRPAMTAVTAAERIADFAQVGRSIMERTGRLFAVGLEAAATEPLIEESWQGGRRATWHAVREFWAAMQADGLLGADVDLDWLTETATVLSEPETFLMIGKLWGWDLDRYQAWLRSSYTRLAAGSA